MGIYINGKKASGRGADGLGVPAGGSAGQVLAKKSSADNDTEWVDQSGGVVSDHTQLTNRDASDQHPISSVTDLADELAKRIALDGPVTTTVDPAFGSPPYTIEISPDHGGGGSASAENVSFDNTDTGMTATNVQEAVNELFTDVSDGKSLVASAITDKGVPTASDATFQTMATNISAIQTGSPVALTSIEITTMPDKLSYAPGETFDPTGMYVMAQYNDGEMFSHVTDFTFSPSGELTEDDDEVTVSYTYQGVTKTATVAIEVSGVKIYGVSWDGTSTTKWVRTDAAASFTDPVPYVSGSTSYGSPFDDILPWSGMVRVTDSSAGELVAIPKFWYKLEQISNSGMRIQIANEYVDGFSCSPAHMNRGDGKGERDVVYIGRYHCHTSNYKSQTGGNPRSNETRSTFRSGIHGLGNTIWMYDFLMRFTLWLLYIVEFADWNSQKVIGYGCGNNSGVQAMGYTDSMPYHTGTTQSDRATYGLGTQYRNIEGLWDNVLDWIDGCYHNSSGLNIILNPANSSDSTGGTSAGVPSRGYPSKFTVKTVLGVTLFYPTEASGSETTYSCDYWYFSASNPCLFVGGYYNQGGVFGLFYVYDYGATVKYASLGSRLMKLP